MEKISEKDRRIYYQNIVYGVCARLDAVLGGVTVCGTADGPAMEVQKRMDKALGEAKLMRPVVEAVIKRKKARGTGLVNEFKAHAALEYAVETYLESEGRRE